MSTIQSIDYLALAPVLVLALGSVLVLVVDLLVARGPAVPGWLALAVVVSAAALVPASAQRSTLCVAGAAAEPGTGCGYLTLGPTLAFQGIALAAQLRGPPPHGLAQHLGLGAIEPPRQAVEQAPVAIVEVDLDRTLGHNRLMVDEQ